MCQQCKEKAKLPYDRLDADEQKLVDTAWKMARRASDFGVCSYSNFPVGCAILARNRSGTEKVFGGCNVENVSSGLTICAERTAAVKAASEGFTEFLVVALICVKAPGETPCGACRQVLWEFGKKAVVMCITGQDSSVVRWMMAELLPGRKR